MSFDPSTFPPQRVPNGLHGVGPGEARVPVGVPGILWPSGAFTTSNPDGSSSYVCQTVEAVEDSFARASVYSFAASEFREQQETVAELHRRRFLGYDRMHGADRRTIRPCPPFSVFLKQSREIRIKRERDATMYNDSTRHDPGIKRRAF